MIISSLRFLFLLVFLFAQFVQCFVFFFLCFILYLCVILHLSIIDQKQTTTTKKKLTIRLDGCVVLLFIFFSNKEITKSLPRKENEDKSLAILFSFVSFFLLLSFVCLYLRNNIDRL